jgi:PAS domain S-box-containing protein
LLVDTKTGVIQAVNTAGHTLLGCGSYHTSGLSIQDILTTPGARNQNRDSGDPCRAQLHNLNGIKKDVYVWTIPLHCRGIPMEGLIIRDAGKVPGEAGIFATGPATNADIFEHLSEGIVFVDMNGDITHWNRGAETILRIPAAEACGRPVWEVRWRLLPDDFRTPEALIRMKEAVIKRLEQKGHNKEDVMIVTPDGDRRVISSEEWVIPSPEGSLFLVVMQDITSTIELQAQKRRLDHDLSGWVRELRSLFRLSELLTDPSLSLENLCRHLLGIIPGALQYPKKAQVRICVREICVFSSGWQENSGFMETMIMVKGRAEGRISVYYSDKKRTRSHNPFLPQEEKLLEVIAARIGEFIERMDAYASLEASEKKFREIIERISDLILIFDDKGRINFASPSFEKMTGSPLSDLTGDPQNWPLDQSVLDEIRDAFERNSRGETASGLELALPGSGDILRICEFSSNPIISDGVFKGVQVIGRDITERKKTELALEESARQYGHLIANINDALFSLDENGVVTYMSPVITRMIGYPPDHLIGHSYEEFIFPEDLPDVRDSFQKTLLDEPVKTTFRIVTADGDVRYMKSSSRGNRDGIKICGITGILTDITAEKQLEEIKKERFVEIEQNLEYLAILNDKIRNPLSVITGIADAMDIPEKDVILNCVWEIDGIIQQLDRGWLQSEKIRKYLIKHYGFPGTGR